MLRLAVDTCVVIAAINEDEPCYRSCRELFELAAGGDVELLVSSTFDYDQEKAWESNPDRAARNGSWLSDSNVTRIPGPFVLDVSRLGSDVLVSDEQAAVYERLMSEFGSAGSDGGFSRRKALDAHHHMAAILASADVFVTLDESDVLGRLRKATDGSVPLQVISPEEAVTMVNRASSDLCWWLLRSDAEGWFSACCR